MEGDDFDSNELLNRRTEVIETQSFESIHARCCGDPEQPLILYLHAPVAFDAAAAAGKPAAAIPKKAVSTGGVVKKEKVDCTKRRQIGRASCRERV